MKKSFTTIALFSLVLVATSFTTPENIISSETVSSLKNPIDGGVSVGGGRKQDIFAAQVASTANYRQPIDGGVSVGGGRKQD
ncbi:MULTISPECIES: hypothetical protein [unclassified Flavobacterium]|uniref:hypothetical protein n=1 Tax=unclassified Flavobacterium TaxID=196869 RepID=UPI000F0CF46C|nr:MULTISPECIES: hypothetical protein [unclassified Flavobacterium]AYN05993.1 hypothetical protein EAG11_18905 [Flavobacterium sp. 140616W15]MCD0476478.1 hypothetical protein [Flavobacterium sp. EDS]